VAQAPNTNSTLSLPSGINKTSTAISTNIIILVNNTPVGAIQSLAITERRPIRMIDEVGTDGHIDSVPNQSTNVTGTCQRVRFDRLRIAESLGRGFLHNKSQQYPFDIVILDKQKRDQANQISTVIKNVWISEISYTYQVSDWVITESMNWEAEDIFSILNNGSNVPAAQGGELGIKHAAIPTETLADTGARRGSLDGAGLIDLASTIPDLF